MINVVYGREFLLNTGNVLLAEYKPGVQKSWNGGGSGRKLKNEKFEWLPIFVFVISKPRIEIGLD